jgi:hypothetical protein
MITGFVLINKSKRFIFFIIWSIIVNFLFLNLVLFIINYKLTISLNFKEAIQLFLFYEVIIFFAGNWLHPFIFYQIKKLLCLKFYTSAELTDSEFP